jgi:hypothetical protein
LETNRVGYAQRPMAISWWVGVGKKIAKKKMAGTSPAMTL